MGTGLGALGEAVGLEEEMGELLAVGAGVGVMDP